jgi:hypothetical protein
VSSAGTLLRISLVVPGIALKLEVDLDFLTSRNTVPEVSEYHFLLHGPKLTTTESPRPFDRCHEMVTPENINIILEGKATCGLQRKWAANDLNKISC